MSLIKAFLFIQAIALGGFGLLLFFKPELALVFLGVPSLSPDGVYEIRSIYGGTSLGASLLMFASLGILTAIIAFYFLRTRELIRGIDIKVRDSRT